MTRRSRVGNVPLRERSNRKDGKGKAIDRGAARALEVQHKTLQAKFGEQEQAKDTRRKILLNAFVLHRQEKGQDEFSRHLAVWRRKEQPGFLNHEYDKAPFYDLVNLSAAAKPENAKAGA